METVPPATKFDPEIVTVVVDPGATDGAALVTLGAGSTVKHPVHVAFPPSGLVTVTFTTPGVAPEATEMATDRWLESVNDTLFTPTPPPENDTLAPEANPVPT